MVSGSALSAEGRRFAEDVKLRDIVSCARFITTHPEILTEQDSDRKYTREAISALRVGNPYSRNLAESYVEKCLIVRNCRGKSTREIAEYLQPLVDGDKDAWDDFYDDSDAILDSLKKYARANPTEAIGTQATAQNTRRESRHTDVEEITRGISQLSTGSATTSGIPIYTKPASRHHADFPSSAQVPSSRHAPAISSRPRSGAKPPTEPRTANSTPRRDSTSPDARDGGQRPSRHDHQKAGVGDDSRSQGTDLSPTHFIPSVRGNAVPKAVAIESKMDPRFKKKDAREAGRFFRIGRVFAMLWHTEVQKSALSDDISQAKWTMTTSPGVRIFSHIRHFAVVREGHGYCWAIPINVYKGQGVKKRGFNKADVQAHAIVYMQGTRPLALNEEPYMPKNPIQVVPADADSELDKASRINFAKVHTVE